MGPNNAGLEHFKDNPHAKLIRETIQNSLDAHDPDLPPVEIEIKQCEISARELGLETLLPHLEQCLQTMQAKNQAAAAADYKQSIEQAKQDTIPCLAIIDNNTTGLTGRHWDSLILEEGIPEKGNTGSPGGSFGIGKNAPYNIAGLHAVYYSTRYWNGRKGKEQKLMGRAQLVSHPDPGGSSQPNQPIQMLQHIGFYANQQGPSGQVSFLGPQPIFPPELPAAFELKNNGTGIWIAGFTPPADWTREAAKAVLENFFQAVYEGNLKVTLKDSQAETIISKEKIGSLMEKGIADSDYEHYYRAIHEPMPLEPAEGQGRIGKIQISLRVSKYGPNRVAYVNRKGMLITDSGRVGENPFHNRSGSWPAFTAVVQAIDDKTDQLIRRMENPAHTAINIDRLTGDERREVEEDLKAAREQIRQLIDQAIKDQESEEAVNIAELAELLPDQNKTAPVGPRAWIKERKTRAPATQHVEEIEESTTDVPDDNGETEEDQPAGADHAGEGRRPQTPSETRPGATRAARPRNIRRASVFKHDDTEIRALLQFTEGRAGEIKIELRPTGEDNALREAQATIHHAELLEPGTGTLHQDGNILTITPNAGGANNVSLRLLTDPDSRHTGYAVVEHSAPEPKTKTTRRRRGTPKKGN